MYLSRWGGVLGVCLLALGSLWSCRREAPSNFDSNIAPETIISGAPAESTLSFYQVHVFWYGQDPDGLVDHYEYSVTDSNKTPGEDDPGFAGYYQTTRTDSIFRLKADRPQILGHRFYVRAVDNEGKRDPTPAWTYFVAHNFNFPMVLFNRAEARWIDRAGNERTVQLTSHSINSPTDTIGVGASVSFTWEGRDEDSGPLGPGYVTGYEYRTTQDQEYAGGTLSDTSFSTTYAQPAGAELTAYFTGNDALEVRAIDDAGARTNPDSVRSYVVGFGPVTWIVDPQQVSPPARRVVFTDKDTGVTWPSGTTLADDTFGRNIKFLYTGFDDARDMSLDPNNPSGIIGFEYRKLQDGGGVAYQPITDWNPFPLVNDFLLPVATNLGSGDYKFLVRAVDELGRKGRPETVAVSVNYGPFFQWVRYVAPNGTETPLWRPNGDPVTIVLTEEPGGGYADLHVRFFAVDAHYPPPDQDPLDPNDVVETELSSVRDYLSRLNGARDGYEDAPQDDEGNRLPGDKHFPVLPGGGRGFVEDGTNELELRVRDLSGRVALLNVVFEVQLQ